MRCSFVIISSYVRMLRTSFAENAAHGMGERANAERASSEERASNRNRRYTPGSPSQGALLSATRRVPVLPRHITAMAVLLLRGRRYVGRHVVTLDVPRPAIETPKGRGIPEGNACRSAARRPLRPTSAGARGAT